MISPLLRLVALLVYILLPLSSFAKELPLSTVDAGLLKGKTVIVYMHEERGTNLFNLRKEYTPEAKQKYEGVLVKREGQQDYGQTDGYEIRGGDPSHQVAMALALLMSERYGMTLLRPQPVLLPDSGRVFVKDFDISSIPPELAGSDYVVDVETYGMQLGQLKSFEDPDFVFGNAIILVDSHSKRVLARRFCSYYNGHAMSDKQRPYLQTYLADDMSMFKRDLKKSAEVCIDSIRGDGLQGKFKQVRD